MNVNGSKWEYMKVYEALRLYRNACESVWMYKSQKCGLWKYMSVNSSKWVYMKAYEAILWYMNVYKSVWM